MISSNPVTSQMGEMIERSSALIESLSISLHECGSFVADKVEDLGAVDVASVVANMKFSLKMIESQAASLQVLLQAAESVSNLPAVHPCNF